jgi:hypothetical protein
MAMENSITRLITGDQHAAKPLLNKGLHTHRINADSASSGIRTHDPNVRSGENILCLKLYDHRDHLLFSFYVENYITLILTGPK